MSISPFSPSFTKNMSFPFLSLTEINKLPVVKNVVVKKGVFVKDNAVDVEVWSYHTHDHLSHIDFLSEACDDNSFTTSEACQHCNNSFITGRQISCLHSTYTIHFFNGSTLECFRDIKKLLLRVNEYKDKYNANNKEECRKTGNIGFYVLVYSLELPSILEVYSPFTFHIQDRLPRKHEELTTKEKKWVKKVNNGDYTYIINNENDFIYFKELRRDILNNITEQKELQCHWYHHIPTYFISSRFF